jgi:CheY-like chemotaxis protein
MDTYSVAASPSQTVVIVDGNLSVVDMLESVLDEGRYDMVFVNASGGAYPEIKRLQPRLVVLCTRIESLDGFRLLSMLKLDADTKDIPVLTYTTEYEGQETIDDDSTVEDSSRLPSTASPMRMN